MSELTDRIYDAENELSVAQNGYLMKTGWKNVCDVPGSYWMWQKQLPDGRILLADKNFALTLQTHFDD